MSANYPELAAAVAAEAERRHAELTAARAEMPELAARSTASRAG